MLVQSFGVTNKEHYCMLKYFHESIVDKWNIMVGGMVQNSTNQNHHQHQQPICSATFFFYINNKIRPTSTINIIINHRNMPNSTTRENQHQQKFLFSSTTICLTTNIGIDFNNKTRSTIWGRTTGYGRGRLVHRNSNHRACWEIETR